MTIHPAFRLGAQAALAVAIAIGLYDLGWTERPLWVAATAMLIVCGSFGENLVRGAERTLGTIAGVVAAHFVWLVVAPWPGLQFAVILAALFGFLITFGGSYRWSVFWATILVLILLHYLLPSGEYEIIRLVDTLIGAGIGVVASLVLLPMRVTTRAEADFRSVLDDAARLLDAAIAALGRAEEAVDMSAELDALHARLDALLPLLPAVMFEARVGLGGPPDLPRRIEALRLALRFLHAFAGSLSQATGTGLGPKVAPELQAVAQRIAGNVASIRLGLDRRVGPLRHLAELRARLYRRLEPIRSEGPEARRDLLRFTAVIFHITQVNRAFLEIGAALGLPIETPDQDAVKAPA